MFRVSPDCTQADLFDRIEKFLRERDQQKLNDPDALYNLFLDQITEVHT